MSPFSEEFRKHRTEIQALTPGINRNIFGIVISEPIIKKIATTHGKSTRLQHLRIQDATGVIGLTLWGDRILDFIDIYDGIFLSSGNFKQNHLKKWELQSVTHGKIQRIAWPKCLDIGPEEIKVLIELKKRLKKNIPHNLPADPEALGLKIEQGHITALYLAFTGLESLPPNFGSLKRLTRLNLNNNHLEVFPPEILRLSGLSRLNLSWNRLTHIPDGISSCNTLKDLDLSHNNIPVIPDAIRNLNKLRRLTLDHNPLQRIPGISVEILGISPTKFSEDLPLTEKLALFTLETNLGEPLPQKDEIRRYDSGYTVNGGHVREIGLFTKRLTAVPPIIGNFRKLEKINLSSNRIAEISDELANIPTLQTIFFQGNRFREVPGAIFQIYARKYRNESLNDPDLEFLVSFELAFNERLFPLETPTSTSSGYIAHEGGIIHLNLSNRDLQESPPKLEKLTQLELLDLSGNKLTTFPAEITKLTQLKSLSMENNEIAHLPEDIKNLSNLRAIKLNSNRIIEFSPNFSFPGNCEEIYLNSNQITALPSIWPHNSSLHILEVNFNKLEGLPDSLHSLTSLKQLKLNYNDFESIPQIISKLSCIERLSLAANKIVQSHFAIIPQSRLKAINLEYNRLSEVPNFIPKLDMLEELNLKNNPIAHLPAKLLEHPALKSLQITFRNIQISPQDAVSFELALNKGILANSPTESNVPIEIAPSDGRDLLIVKILLSKVILSYPGDPLQALKKISWKKRSNSVVHLDISGQKLKQIPKLVFELSQLEELNLSNNSLVSVPPAIGKLHTLKILNFSQNKIESVPETLGTLPRLTDLNLSRNKLSELPDSLENLAHLERISLQGNNFSDIPGCFWNLNFLQKFPFTRSIPPLSQPFLASRSLDDLRAYTHRRRFFLTEIQSKIHKDQGIDDFDRKELKIRHNAAKLFQICGYYHNSTAETIQEVIQDTLRVKGKKFDIIL